MKTITALTTVLLSVISTGCGNWDAVYRKHNFSDGNSAITDIKSRAIIASVNEQSKISKEDSAYSKSIKICAEPSPDAITAYAAELAAKVQKGDDLSGGLTGAYQGSAGFTGQRTQTVQLLRDQLYRLCEANLNGWLRPAEYEMLLSRNQRYTLALMAIENLTDVIRPPAIILETSGRAGLSSDSAETEKKLATLKTRKLELESKENKTQEETEEIEKITNEIAKLEKNPDEVKNAYALGKATGKADVPPAPEQREKTEIHVNAIKEIALSLIEESDTLYKCFNYLQDSSTYSRDDDISRLRSAFEAHCLELLKTETLALQADNKKASQEMRKIEDINKQ